MSKKLQQKQKKFQISNSRYIRSTEKRDFSSTAVEAAWHNTAHLKDTNHRMQGELTKWNSFICMIIAVKSNNSWSLIYTITVNSRQDIQSSDMFEDTDQKYIYSFPTAVDQHFHLTYHTCLNNSLKMHPTALKLWNISPKPRCPPPYLQQTGPAETASSRQTAETSFWLPGAFPSSPPAIYTALAEGQRACQWRWRSATAAMSAIVCQDSCLARSGMLRAERSRNKLDDHVVVL